MKKSKKFLSLLLSLAMVLPVVSVPAMADDVPAATTLSPTADAYVGGSSDPSPSPASSIVRLGRNYTVTDKSPDAWNAGYYVGAFAYDVASVFSTLEANPGYAIKSVTFKPTVNNVWNAASVSGLKLNFYPINAKWSEAAADGYVEFTNANLANVLPIDSAQKDSKPAFTAEPAVSLSADTSTGAKSFDITSLFKLHQANNQNTDLKNFFSFVIAPTADKGKFEYDIDSKDKASGDTAEPNPAALVIEYYKPEVLVLSDSTLPMQPKDDVELTYNNYIESAIAKINDVDVDAQYITIADKTVTVDYPFAKNTYYTIEVTAIDENGGSYTFSASFTTTYNTESVNASFVSTHNVGSSTSTSVSANYSTFGANGWGNGVIVYGFTIPEKPSNGYIEKSEFTFWLKEPQTALVYEFITDSAIAGLTLADAKAIMTNDVCLTESAQETGNVFKDNYADNWTQYKADVSSYLNKLHSLGKTGTAYIAVASNSTANASPHSRTNTPAALTCTINTQPSVEVSDSSFDVRGSVLLSVSVELPTVFDSETLLSNLVLRDAATKDAANVSFSYDPASRKISLAAATTLAENKVYELVINEGTADLYGNIVSAGGFVVIGNIATGANTVATTPILVAATTEIDNANGTTNFALLTPLTEVADAKAVAKVTNHRTTSTTVRIAAAAYDANGELLSIGINDVWIRGGSTFTIASSAISADGAATIKAFVWDYYDQVTPFAASCTIGAAR